MRIGLEQRQMLKMVMTTELRQAIELLQLSTYELLQFIHEQAEENPFIELIEKEETFTDDRRSNNTVSEPGANPVEFAAKNEKNMHDYLIDQIMLLHLNEKEYELIRYLILNINEQGYLVVNDEDVMERLNVHEEELQRAKDVLYGLEPLGIGASDLAHCLSIQAKVIYPDEELLFYVIENHLQLIADKQWTKLAKQVNVPLSKVKDLFEKIQTLHPKPAASLSSTKVDYVTPDIFIQTNELANEYTIQLNDYYVPNLTFNNHFSAQVKSKELSQYTNNQFKKFEWLQNSIEQRRTTILKIMQVIVNKQQNFLEKGFQSLKPLTLKDVADEIEMHESTVSRATANKIVQTPVGTFELRRLFSTKVSNQTGGDMSQTKVKTVIEEMIANENKYSPLSDQKIADQLKEKNEITISRRTVAKYRGELQIPPSSRRKEIEICAE